MGKGIGVAFKIKTMSSKVIMRGLPVEYCTNDKYIRSHLSALETAAAVGKVDSPLKIQQIHKSLGQDVMERGVVGKFRNFEHTRGPPLT